MVSSTSSAPGAFFGEVVVFDSTSQLADSKNIRFGEPQLSLFTGATAPSSNSAEKEIGRGLSWDESLFYLRKRKWAVACLGRRALFTCLDSKNDLADEAKRR